MSDPFDRLLDWAVRMWRRPGRLTVLSRELEELGRSRAELIDQLRQVEWHLAMCRSTAHDVHSAHAIAGRALEKHGGPFPTSASNCQRSLVKANADKRRAAHPALAQEPRDE
jgi:hypothetical protein